MPSCHQPLTAGRLGCLLIGILWTAAAAGQTPTREYIYFGGRAIAIENPPPPPIVVTVSPSSATVASGGTVQFTKTVTGTTNENVTWSVVESGGGTISSTGLYTAPTVSTQSQFTIRATSQADSTTFGTATVTVNPVTVTVDPPTATVVSGGTVQFTKTVTGTTNQNVTWSVVESGGGTISSTGLYTAPTVSTQAQFTIRATSQADSTRFGTATVTVNPVISVTVSPSAATVASGGTVQFTPTVTGTTNQGVTWSVVESGGGTIDQSGLYTAPTVSTQSQFTIRATSQADTSKFGSATVTVIPPCTVIIDPASAMVYSGRKQTLQATTSNCGAAGVTWTLGPGAGTLSASGLTATYTAPQGVVSTQTATVQATVTGGTATATASITIQPSQPPALYTMSPNNSSGTRQQFSFTVSDAQGQADIAGLQVVFLSDWAYTCQVSFNAEFSLLGFRLDNGTWTDVPLGAAQAPTNSNCTLYAATSSVSRSGNQLTLTLDLQFKPIFSGQKSVLAAASDFAGNIVGFQEVGKWLVPGTTGTSQASVIQFWTPSQVAPGQSFQVALTVRNTGQNIWQSNGLNPTQPHRLVSWDPQGNSTWGVSSIELPVQQVLPGQDVTILINATAPYSLGTQSFAWRMLYQGVEPFGQTASASITVTSTPYPESPHPYPNSTNQSWSYSYNGSCGSLNVTFDSQTFLQSGDWLYVTDINGYAIAGSPFSGSTLAGQTVSVPGSSVFLQLVSNASGNGWGFRVTNVTCVPPPPPPGFYDDFHPDVLYTSNWYHDTQFSQPRNGTISYSDTAWASVELSFYGTGIQYYYTKAFNRGIAYVYIDGQYAGSVDQYSPTIEWQSSRMFGNLPRGYHTIRIYVSGTKQSASQWHWVDVDGFQTYQ
ncbi:MAG: NBR1-Ig-like domain-containing protein [Acidobacteriota bacterium]